MQMGVFNHTAWVDAILLMWLFAPSGVSLEKNAHIPIVGTCIRAFQNIWVPRSAHGSAQKAKEGRGDAPSVSDLIADRWEPNIGTSTCRVGSPGSVTAVHCSPCRYASLGAGGHLRTFMI
jgi:hypothetical protein